MSQALPMPRWLLVILDKSSKLKMLFTTNGSKIRNWRSRQRKIWLMKPSTTEPLLLETSPLTTKINSWLNCLRTSEQLLVLNFPWEILVLINTLRTKLILSENSRRKNTKGNWEELSKLWKKVSKLMKSMSNSWLITLEKKGLNYCSLVINM